MVVLAMAGYVLLGMSAMSLALRWPAGDLLTARVDAVAFACVGLLLHVLVQPYLPHRLLSARTQRLSLAFASGCAIQWALG